MALRTMEQMQSKHSPKKQQDNANFSDVANEFQQVYPAFLRPPILSPHS